MSMLTSAHLESIALTDASNGDTAPDMAIELATIQKRKAQVEAELADIARRRQELEQEANELATVERVFARLMNVDLPEGDRVRSPDVAVRRKPRDIPSVFVMTATIIREQVRSGGRHWIEASTIIQIIKERWWSTAEPGDISPTLWRLHKAGKLQKNGTAYALPPGIEANGTNNGLGGGTPALSPPDGSAT